MNENWNKKINQLIKGREVGEKSMQISPTKEPEEGRPGGKRVEMEANDIRN